MQESLHWHKAGTDYDEPRCQRTHLLGSVIDLWKNRRKREQDSANHKTARHRKENQFICGFSMETENMVENSRRKLEEKKADMIVANNLKQKGAGFGTDTNIVTFITRDKVLEKSIMTKKEVAKEILDFILEHIF